MPVPPRQSSTPPTVSPRQAIIPGFPLLLLLAIATAQPCKAIAQLTPIPARNLPAEPGQTQTPASIAGTVQDIGGTAVRGARINLINSQGLSERITTSDDQGHFAFPGLIPGTFQVTVTASGLESFVSPQIQLAPGQAFDVPGIAMPLAGTHTVVVVTATREEMANEQVKAEEKQRAFAIFPNFYTTYLSNAAPLQPRNKYKLAFRAVTDPVVFLSTGIAAGIEQANNTFPGYGQGAAGYARRYGAAYGDETIARFLGSAILPSAFHQDPRYFYRGTGTIRARALYAISSAVVCRGDNGNRQFNASYVLGSFAAAGISNLYRDDRDRTASITLRNGALIVAGHAANNLIREFISRKVTSNVPAYEQGKSP